MDFNENNCHFSLTYTVDTSIEAPTVLYMNQEYYYTTGYDLVLKSGGQLVPTTSYSLKQSGNFAEVIVTDTSYNGVDVKI